MTRDSVFRPGVDDEKPAKLAELADRRFITVGENTSLLEVMNELRAAQAIIALVQDDAKQVMSAATVRGLITKQQIADAVLDSTELFTA